MHRTQLLLENWQYEALKARAHREGKTLSAWIRRWLGSVLAPVAHGRAKSSKGLEAICGIGRDAEGPSGTDHDQVLYSWNKKR